MEKIEIKGKVVIHCPTESDCLKLFTFLYDNGYYFADKLSPEEALDYWTPYRDVTRIYINHKFAMATPKRLLYGTTRVQNELTVDEFLEKYGIRSISQLVDDLDHKIELMERRLSDG